MAVDAKNTYFISGDSTSRLSFVGWVIIVFVRLAVGPLGTIAHNRYVVQTSVTGVSPVIIEITATAGVVAVIDPFVE